MVGLFALTELVSMIFEGGTIAKAGRLEGSLWDGFWDTFRYPFTLIQSTAVGAFLGMIPGHRRDGGELPGLQRGACAPPSIRSGSARARRKA